MLKTLHIENYALIHETDISFDSGFVVVTGETGAGKSILLGALGLLLGQRADTQVLSDKGRKCVVEGVFDIHGLGLRPIFEEHDADYDDTLILRREILPSAKSRSFVNDTPASLQLLKALGIHLVDIHSQYQTLTLTESNFQTRLLDTLSNESPIAQYRQAHQRYTSLKRQLEQLTAQESEDRKEADYRQFLFEELHNANLQEGEQESLEEEQRLMEHIGVIKESLDEVDALCEGQGTDNDNALARLVAARNRLAHAASYHSSVEQLHERMESAIIELQDILSECASVNDKLQFSPERQALVSERLDLIYRLEKKHHVNDIASLLIIERELDEQLQAAESLDDRIREVMEQVDRAFSEMHDLAERLTVARQASGKLLGQLITPILAQVGMTQARIITEITPAQEYGPLGHDTVRLLFNANKGGALRPLAEVASGGELSRLMLAVKAVVSHRELLPTIIFDEIDSGVSGDISVAVGDIMRQMAQNMQVIAITHLPQIAAKADQHLKVAKGLETHGDGTEERTVSRIHPLNKEERINEIAVMLSSNPPTAAALQTAKELMSQT